MTDTPKTTRARILRDFNDAGTGQNFTADTVVPIEDGAFANYRHAGLVEAAAADDAKSAPKTPPAPDAPSKTSA